MKMNRTVSMLTILAALMTGACASTFSGDALDQVDRKIGFRELQANPDAFKGKTVLLGGMIIETRNTTDGTFVEVLQRPLDRDGRPHETDETGGRFIISSPQFLDAAVYQPGKRISVIGQVSGQEIRPLGELHYRYPLITPREIHLWEPRNSPSVSFGFGVGVYHGR